MKFVGAIALFALVACVNAGYLGPPVFHGPVLAAHPVVKAVHPVYAVHPPILAKPIVYHHHPAPVVKVLHHPVPVVKHVAFGPYAYGAYGLHHHHPHFF